MSDENEPLEPLDADLQELLSLESSAPPDPADAARAARVLEAVRATVGGGAPPSAPQSPPSGGAGGAAGGSRLAGSSIAIGAAALTAGLVAGAALHAMLAEPEVREVVRIVEVPAPAIDAADAGAAASIEIADEPPAVAEPAADAGRASRVRDDQPGSLERESALISRAHMALARGSPELAIVALREHERRYPDGELGEDREMLWISALAATGAIDEARVRADRFRREHPGSPLQSAIDATLAGATP